MQTRLESLVEAFINCVLGYCVSFMANATILPMVGIPVTIKQNLLIGAGMTVVPLQREQVSQPRPQPTKTMPHGWLTSPSRRLQSGHSSPGLRLSLTACRPCGRRGPPSPARRTRGRIARG